MSGCQRDGKKALRDRLRDAVLRMAKGEATIEQISEEGRVNAIVSTASVSFRAGVMWALQQIGDGTWPDHPSGFDPWIDDAVDRHEGRIRDELVMAEASKDFMMADGARKATPDDDCQCPLCCVRRALE